MGGPGSFVERVEEPTEEHAAAFGRLVPQLSSSPPPDLAALRRIANQPAVSILVARREGPESEIVGTLTLITVTIATGVRAIIEDVVVDEGARGSGVGAALVAEATWLASELGAQTIDLTSRPAREAANRLYLRAGFAQRQTNVYRYTVK